jgi:hypothetical protein
LFKPGESATLLGGSNKVVTVQAVLPALGGVWSIQTDEGTYDERQLIPAHPSVYFKEEPRILTPEFVEKLAADNQRRSEERSAKVNQEGDKNEVFPVDR